MSDLDAEFFLCVQDNNLSGTIAAIARGEDDALRFCARKNYPEMIALLLEHGADVHAHDNALCIMHDA